MHQLLQLNVMVHLKYAAKIRVKALIAAGLVVTGLAACVGAPVNTAVPPTPAISPTRIAQPPATVVPASGPTLAASSQVALSFLNALPNQVGRFTLAKNPDDPSKPKLNYVGTDSKTGAVVGALATYQLNGKQVKIALWLTVSTNYALDRYNQEISYTKVPIIPVEVGDQAMVAPTNKAVDNFVGFDPPMLAMLRFRNIEIDVYPTKDLTDAYSDFTPTELTQVLQAMFNALPK